MLALLWKYAMFQRVETYLPRDMTREARCADVTRCPFSRHVSGAFGAKYGELPGERVDFRGCQVSWGHGRGHGMTDWRDDVDEALTAFLAVAELAGDPVSRSDLELEYLAAPHRPPPRLPAGRMAVYGFWGDGAWLKIGKVGPRSNARYTGQHYHARGAISTLAGSLARDPRMLAVAGFDPQAPGAWVRAATHRVNILLPATRHPALLSLLEAFLHLRLRPRYEGWG